MGLPRRIFTPAGPTSPATTPPARVHPGDHLDVAATVTGHTRMGGDLDGHTGSGPLGSAPGQASHEQRRQYLTGTHLGDEKPSPAHPTLAT